MFSIAFEKCPDFTENSASEDYFSKSGGSSSEDFYF